MTADLLVSMYGRSQKYNNDYWDVVGGSLQDEQFLRFKERADKACPNYFDFNDIELPSGGTINIPHLWATINGQLKGFTNVCGWAGDAVQLSHDMQNGASGFPSSSFSVEEWRSDIDACNMKNMFSGDYLTNLDTYLSGVTDQSRLSILTSTGGFTGQTWSETDKGALAILIEQSNTTVSGYNKALESVEAYNDYVLSGKCSVTCSFHDFDIASGDTCVIDDENGNTYNVESSDEIQFLGNVQNPIKISATTEYLRSATVFVNGVEQEKADVYTIIPARVTHIIVAYQNQSTVTFSYTTEGISEEFVEALTITRGYDGAELEGSGTTYTLVKDEVLTLSATSTGGEARRVIPYFNGEVDILTWNTPKTVTLSGDTTMVFKFNDVKLEYVFSASTEGFTEGTDALVITSASKGNLTAGDRYELPSGDIVTLSATTSIDRECAYTIGDNELAFDESGVATITMTGDTTVVVTFKDNGFEPIVVPYNFEYNVTGFESGSDVLSVTSLAMGDLETGNTYTLTSGDVVTLSAVTSDEREFTCKVGDNDLTFDASGVATITMTANTTVLFTFKNKSVITVYDFKYATSGLEEDLDTLNVWINSSDNSVAPDEDRKLKSGDIVYLNPTLADTRTAYYTINGSAQQNVLSSDTQITVDKDIELLVVFENKALEPQKYNAIYTLDNFNSVKGDDVVIMASDGTEINADTTTEITSGTILTISATTSNDRQVQCKVDGTIITLDESGTATITVTEDTNIEFIFSDVTVTSEVFGEISGTLTYPTAPASGDTLSPELSYSQTKTTTYSNGKTEEAVITDGAALTWTNADENGDVTIPASTETEEHDAKTVTVEITMNGKTKTLTCTVKQEAAEAESEYVYYGASTALPTTLEGASKTELPVSSTVDVSSVSSDKARYHWVAIASDSDYSVTKAVDADSDSVDILTDDTIITGYKIYYMRSSMNIDNTTKFTIA